MVAIQLVARSAGSVRSTLRSAMAVMEPASGPTSANPAVAQPPAASPAAASTSNGSNERTSIYRTSFSFAVAVMGPGFGAGGAGLY